MSLPDTFQFTQAKLQDYDDCPRRFQLRYVLMQPWPALITGQPGEYDRHVARGRDFHRLAHQYTLGLDPGRLEETIHDPILLQWWKTFLENPPAGLPTALRRAEVVVAAPLGGFRLMARFDLLAAEPGERLVLVDWKTVLKPTLRSVLSRRLQTRVYRYLAVEAGAAFNGGRPPQSHQIEMVYWFAPSVGRTESFPYDAEQHAAGRQSLVDLIAEVAAHRGATWPLTPDERRCRFCNYRSLCEREVKPGFLEDLEEDLDAPELEIDLEQIAEIEF